MGIIIGTIPSYISIKSIKSTLKIYTLMDIKRAHKSQPNPQYKKKLQWITRVKNLNYAYQKEHIIWLDLDIICR